MIPDTDLGQFALFAAMAGISLGVLLGPIGQAIARRIRGKDGASGISTGEVGAERLADVEARLAELETTQARLAEIEARLEFAERLLTAPRAGAEGEIEQH